MTEAVSVVVCCHNSAKRLPETLAHLARQEVSSEVPWEVVVVDNASTDDTARVAEAHWPENAPAPLRVVQEPEPGLSHARRRGITEARHGIIGFVDDDNWLAPDWVQRAAEVMAEHPEVGACGGYSEAVCEVPPPDWFEAHSVMYAIGPAPDAQEPGYRNLLWGAGLILRKAAWKQLLQRGFRSRLVGRQGSTLTGGEDSEICFALRLAGWKLWFDPQLRLRHFLSAGRLRWEYLRRVVWADGNAVALDSYLFALSEGHSGLRERLRLTWQWQSLRELKFFVRRPRALLRALIKPSEGDSEVLEGEYHLGRLTGLVRMRTNYDRLHREVRSASWVKLGAVSP